MGSVKTKWIESMCLTAEEKERMPMSELDKGIGGPCEIKCHNGTTIKGRIVSGERANGSWPIMLSLRIELDDCLLAEDAVGRAGRKEQ